MILAKEKRKNNIIEYILYMWQVEDLIRACKFDNTIIFNSLVKAYQQSKETEDSIQQWYMELSEMLLAENKRDSGHLQVIQNLVSDLADLHFKLMDSPEQTDYRNIYNSAYPYIKEIGAKTLGAVKNEIEICLIAVYGMVMLKIQKKEISEGTEKAVKKISNLLAELSIKYKEREAGKLDI